MPNNKMSNLSKLINGSIAVVTLVVMGWAFIKLAPLPQRPNSEQSVWKDQPPAEVPKTHDAIFPKQRTQASTLPMLNFIGEEKARGQDAAEPSEFISQLEATYRTRGYQDLSSGSNLESLRKSRKAAGLYWRSRATDLEMICAIGNDANVNDAPATKPQVYTTVATKNADGGTSWSTYIYAKENRDKAAQDFPGQDPPGIPRPEHTRRLFTITPDLSSNNSTLVAYSSRQTPGELATWYRANMPQSWRYDDLATNEATKLAEGAICFSGVDKFCMVLISSNSANESLIVISVHQK